MSSLIICLILVAGENSPQVGARGRKSIVALKRWLQSVVCCQVAPVGRVELFLQQGLLTSAQSQPTQTGCWHINTEMYGLTQMGQIRRHTDTQTCVHADAQTQYTLAMLTFNPI